jgi:hypothetical protein
MSETKPLITRMWEKCSFIVIATIAFIIPLVFITIFPYDIPNKLVFTVLLGAISAFLALVWIYPKKSITLSFVSKISGFIIYVIIYSSIIIFTFITGLVPYQLSILVTQVDLTMFFAVIATALLSLFLPGYTLALLLKLRNSLTRLETFLFIILSSFLVTALVGFISWTLGSIINYASIIAAVVNAPILCAFLILKRKDLTIRNPVKINLSINVLQYAVIILVISFLLFSYFTVHALNSTLPIIGDEFDHLGTIVKFLSGYSSWQENALSAFTISSYPYFFHLFEAVSIVLSKLSVSTYFLISSVVLLPLPLMAFICLVQTITNKNKLITAISAVVFQVFSGLGWIYAVLNYGTNQTATLLASSTATGDILYSTWFPTITAPYLIDLTIFLLILNLTFKKNLSSKKSLGIFIPLMLLGLLAHLEKVIFLSIIIVIIAFIQLLLRMEKFRLKELSFSLIISCVLGLLLDLLAPKSLLITSYLTIVLLLIVLGLVTFVLSSLLPIFNFSKIRKYCVDNCQNFLIAGGLLAIFILISELFYVNVVGEFDVVPLYYLPIKLGVCAAFILIWLFSISKNNIHRNVELLSLLVVLLVLEFLLYHGFYPLYSIFGTSISEYRFIRDILWPVVAIASTIGIFVILKKIHKVGFKIGTPKPRFINNLFCAVFIGILIISGGFSNLLKVEYITNAYTISDSNAAVADFMAYQVMPDGSSIFAPASLDNILYSVTGAVVYTPETYFYGTLLSNASDFSSFLFALEYLNVSYYIVYKSDNAVSQYLQYYPLLYSTSYYLVYRVTAVAPSVYSETSVLGRNSLTSSLSTYGVDGSIVWADDLESVKYWQADTSSFSNVNSYSGQSTDGLFTLHANGTSASKIVMFYKVTLTSSISVVNDESIFIKFKTGSGTRLIVNVLYKDGSMSNTLYATSVYMNSSSWALSSTDLESGKTIIGFRIGISNLYDLAVSDISANIEYLGISQVSSFSLGYTATVESLSLTNINYTLANQLNSLHSNSLYNIIVTDEDNYPQNTFNELYELAQSGSNIILVGRLSETGFVSHLANITSSGGYLSVSRIQYSNFSYSIPLTTLTSFSLKGGGDVLASYSDEVNSVPLLINFSVAGHGSIYYFNLLPLIDSVKNLNASSFSEVQIVTQAIYHNVLNLSYASIDNRLFYLKNRGSFTIDGNVNAVVGDIILPKNLGLSSSTTQGTQYVLNINGSMTFSASDSGYVSITMNGTLSIEAYGTSIYSSKVSGITLLSTVSQLSGTGHVSFGHLTAGYPYETIYSNAQYDYTGRFDLAVLPMSFNGLFLIYPYSLGDF